MTLYQQSCVTPELCRLSGLCRFCQALSSIETLCREGGMMHICDSTCNSENCSYKQPGQAALTQEFKLTRRDLCLYCGIKKSDYESLQSKLTIAVKALESIEWITKYGAEEGEAPPKDHATISRQLVDKALKEIRGEEK